MSVNIQSFLEKVFLYGALVWLTIQAGVSARLSVGLGVILTSTLEIAQRCIVGRSPEITDPLLVLLLGGSLLALERHYLSLEAASSRLNQRKPTGGSPERLPSA